MTIEGEVKTTPPNVMLIELAKEPKFEPVIVMVPPVDCTTTEHIKLIYKNENKYK